MQDWGDYRKKAAMASQEKAGLFALPNRLRSHG
jgi:hypothetical protein